MGEAKSTDGMKEMELGAESQEINDDQTELRSQSATINRDGE